MTTAEMQTFINILHNQGITALTVRINSYSEYTGNSNTAITKIKAIIPIANAQGITQLTLIFTLGTPHGTTTLGILHQMPPPIATHT